MEVYIHRAILTHLDSEGYKNCW